MRALAVWSSSFGQNGHSKFHVVDIGSQIDPCEDFYQFACGSWIANTPEAPLSWAQISPFSKLAKKYEKAQRELLASDESSTSQAITQARRFYRSCVDAEQEWETNGISGINYVMGKIKFYPSQSLFSFLLQSYTLNLRRYFTEFLVRLMKLIASDLGINYSRTNAAPDILDVRSFTETLHSVETLDIIVVLHLLKNFYNDSGMVRLSEVDGTVYNVSRVDIASSPPE
ncbi:hypothetical protein OSTOST_01504 [Ostertagia ostertagi]